MFNARTLTNDKYFYKRSHWEDQGLFIDTYEMDFTRNAQNISLAFNLPVSEFGLGCYDCSSVLNLNKLIVNNKPYKDNQS